MGGRRPLITTLQLDFLYKWVGIAPDIQIPRDSTPTQYIMVIFEAKISNNIFVEPVQNCQAGEKVAAYQRAVARPKKAEIHPKIHILDNKSHRAFRTYFFRDSFHIFSSYL